MFNDFDFVVERMVAVFCVAVLIGGPIGMWYSAGVEQKAINAQCGTNYSQLDVMFGGGNLTELCRIKNQQLTVK